MHNFRSDAPLQFVKYTTIICTANPVQRIQWLQVYSTHCTVELYSCTIIFPGSCVCCFYYFLREKAVRCADDTHLYIVTHLSNILSKISNQLLRNSIRKDKFRSNYQNLWRQSLHKTINNSNQKKILWRKTQTLLFVPFL